MSAAPESQPAVDDDLRQRYAEALATWALMYPISAWGLSEGARAERLARNWGEVAAKFAMDVGEQMLESWRQRAERAEAELAENTGVMQALRRQRDEAEAAVARARALHPSPAELAASNAESGRLCPTCIEPAPCQTRRALDGEDEEE